MSNVPKLRFKEFSGKWEEKPLGKYGKLINGLTYSPDNIVENGLLVLRSSNIQNEQISFEDNVYVNLSVEDEYLTCENDILICVRNGSKRLIGKSLLISRNLPKSTHGAFMTVFRGDSNKFISHWLKTPMFFKEVHKNLGATINSINGSNLKKFKTFFPNSKEEQEKIASFLTSVDIKIEQLTKKEQLLQQYKKSVMQKIFNQEIRFKAEDGSEFCDWKEYSLKDFLIPTLREVEKPKENYLAIGVRSHCKGTFQKPDSEPDKIAMDKLYVVKENDLIVNITFAWESAIAIVKKEDEGGLVSHRFPTYTFDEKISNSKYFQYVIIQKRFRIMLDLISPGGAGRNRVMSKKDFLTLKWELPCIEEQNKIANFLSSIDTKIEQTQKQLESSKEFKKALLQQMFV